MRKVTVGDDVDWFAGDDRIIFAKPATPEVALWWRRTIFDPYRLTPETVAERFAADLLESTILRFSFIEPTSDMIKLEAVCTVDAVTMFLSGISVTFNGPGTAFFIALIAVDRSFQGNGVATSTIRNLVELGERLGASGLALHASLDAGPWVWLKFGFLPTLQSWEKAKLDILEKLNALGRLVHEDEKERLESILRSEDPASMALLLEQKRLVPSFPRRNYGTEAREVMLGFALVVDSGVEWDGFLDFEDENSMSIFSERCERL